MVSVTTIRRTCRGVAPLALSNASSRRRCRTDSPIVADTTSAITTATIPPKTPDMMINGRLVAIPLYSATPRSSPTYADTPSGSSSRRTRSRAEVPAAGKTPSASGAGENRSASASAKNTDGTSTSRWADAIPAGVKVCGSPRTVTVTRSPGLIDPASRWSSTTCPDRGAWPAVSR
jgi:hypothetical protein